MSAPETALQNAGWSRFQIDRAAAESGRENDPHGYRAEFIQLLKKAK